MVRQPAHGRAVSSTTRLNDTTPRLVTARRAAPMGPLPQEPLIAVRALAAHDPVEPTCTIARAGLPEPW
ncbi:hypothetical protein [Streptomyces sp. NPDC047841]|uniref:hypothetical protein n=1 Tax=Streptomyces sp. NPDC047841 TaxID=3154708 RepID=UPI00345656E1